MIRTRVYAIRYLIDILVEPSCATLCLQPDIQIVCYIPTKRIDISNKLVARFVLCLSIIEHPEVEESCSVYRITLSVILLPGSPVSPAPSPVLAAPVSAVPALFTTVRARPGPFRAVKTASSGAGAVLTGTASSILLNLTNSILSVFDLFLNYHEQRLHIYRF